MTTVGSAGSHRAGRAPATTKPATGVVRGLVNLGASVERAGFIGDTRYVCKRKMHGGRLIFRRQPQAIHISTKFRPKKFAPTRRKITKSIQIDPPPPQLYQKNPSTLNNSRHQPR